MFDRNIYWTIICLLIQLPWYSAGQCLDNNDSQLSSITTDQLQSLTKGSSEFAMKLFKSIATSNAVTDNMLISPISVWAVLILASMGARGKTASELENSLYIQGFSKSQLANAYFLLRDQLLSTGGQSDSKNTLNVANKIFFDSNIPLLNCIANANLNADLESVDFMKNLEAARQAINEWVESQTNNMIRDLIQPGDVHTTTTMILVNAVYFKGQWKTIFKPTSEITDFFVTPNHPVTVDMMKVEGNFRVGANALLGCSAVELPYFSGSVSMIVLLPNLNVEDLIAKLTSETVDALYDSMVLKKLTVFLPKFKVEQTTDLKPYVQRLGMRDMFSARFADFSGFTGDKNSYVDFIRQKAYIDVNEEGTEAAAATALGLIFKMMPLFQKQDTFVCNRPFVFFIRNNVSGVILFGGIIKTPDYK